MKLNKPILQIDMRLHTYKSLHFCSWSVTHEEEEKQFRKYPHFLYFNGRGKTTTGIHNESLYDTENIENICNLFQHPLPLLESIRNIKKNIDSGYLDF